MIKTTLPACVLAVLAMAACADTGNVGYSVGYPRGPVWPYYRDGVFVAVPGSGLVYRKIYTDQAAFIARSPVRRHHRWGTYGGRGRFPPHC